MSLETVKSQLKSLVFNKVYLFYGEENYLKRYYSEKIAEALVGEKENNLNYAYLKDKVRCEDLLENCQSLPFFSEKKVILVRNSGLFKPSKKSESSDKKEKAPSDPLLDILADIPDYCVIIFNEDEIDKRLKAVNAVSKNGLVVEIGRQNPMDIMKWANKRFNAAGKKISAEALRELVESCEPGMDFCLNEIEKLILYAWDKTEIKKEDVFQVCGKSIKSRVFDLTDAIAEKNRQKAFLTLEEMIEIKEPVQKLFIMLAKHLSNIYEMKLCEKEVISFQETVKYMGIAPFAAQKISRQTKLFDAANLLELIRKSHEMDVSVKSGKITDKTAIDILIAAS